VLVPGASRQQLARKLNSAYADGLLSESTFLHRIDLLFDRRVIDPISLVGDLTRRASQRNPISRLMRTVASRFRQAREATLLALDWSGAHDELLVGRNPECDVRLADLSVSRRHARLVFRDGAWIVQDLASTNGTAVNGKTIGRCRLQPGDELAFGDETVLID
jgi:FHA domain-containing protein